VAQRSTPNVSGSSSATPSGATTPKKTNINVNSNTSIKFSTPSTSAKGRKVDQEQLDISALGLGTPTKTNEAEEPAVPEEVPKVGLAKEKLLEEARRAIDGGLEGKKAVSIVVIGMSV
jgi:elongation factor 1 alpha-like protein